MLTAVVRKFIRYISDIDGKLYLLFIVPTVFGAVRVRWHTTLMMFSCDDYDKGYSNYKIWIWSGVISLIFGFGSLFVIRMCMDSRSSKYKQNNHDGDGDGDDGEDS